MTVVYLDRVLLLNLLVDYLLLLTTAQLAGIPLRRGRLALCAAVGALYAGAVFPPGLSWLSLPLCRTAVGAAMALAAVLVFLRYRAVAQKQFGGISGDLAGWFLQKAELWMLAALAACSLLSGVTG